jgi:hypothetical protein
MFAEQGFATRGFGKINHPVCGSAKHNPGECDPLAWTIPYFHAPSENRWTCTIGMAETMSDCRGAVPSHYTVSEAEEAEMALPDTQVQAPSQTHSSAPHYPKHALHAHSTPMPY